ncbi:hypothetical protein FACS1894151_11240 [Spirochaetia bacterium]|nr:hypothetical protein FACS1894151_11240 [Spirochaetia bacterium]
MIETDNDKQDNIVLMLNKLAEFIFRAAALCKKKQINVETVVYVDNDGNDAAAYVYDYRVIQMKSSDTLDKLAQTYMGDPSLGPIIAYYNKIQNEHNIEAGTNIRIPILTKNRSNQDNYIYASPDMQDNYGVDIALTDTGGFAVSPGGDFQIVKGKDNLAQALANRFATSSEKRIRLGAYGIRAAIGDPLAVNSFLMGSIEQTTYEDPRIDRVEDITFQGKKDSLNISVNYTDINGNQGIYKGEI